jgi:hypothetical protein
MLKVWGHAYGINTPGIAWSHLVPLGQVFSNGRDPYGQGPQDLVRSWSEILMGKTKSGLDSNSLYKSQLKLINMVPRPRKAHRAI